MKLRSTFVVSKCCSRFKILITEIYWKLWCWNVMHVLVYLWTTGTCLITARCGVKWCILYVCFFLFLVRGYAITRVSQSDESSRLVINVLIHLCIYLYMYRFVEISFLMEYRWWWWWWCWLMFYGHFYAQGRLNGPSDFQR